MPYYPLSEEERIKVIEPVLKKTDSFLRSNPAPRTLYNSNVNKNPAAPNPGVIEGPGSIVPNRQLGGVSAATNKNTPKTLESVSRTNEPQSRQLVSNPANNKTSNQSNAITGDGGIKQPNRALPGQAQKPSALPGQAQEPVDYHKQAIDYFAGQGWSREQAAGIVGNLMQESGFNPDVISGKRLGDGNKAYGVAQWHPERQESFRTLYNKPIQGSSFQEQLQFIHDEMTKGLEKAAGDRLRKAKTPEEAAAIFDQFYERSAGTERDKRIKYANDAFAKYGKANTSEATTNIQATVEQKPWQDVLSNMPWRDNRYDTTYNPERNLITQVGGDSIQLPEYYDVEANPDVNTWQYKHNYRRLDKDPNLYKRTDAPVYEVTGENELTFKNASLEDRKNIIDSLNNSYYDTFIDGDKVKLRYNAEMAKSYSEPNKPGYGLYEVPTNGSGQMIEYGPLSKMPNQDMVEARRLYPEKYYGHKFDMAKQSLMNQGHIDEEQARGINAMAERRLMEQGLTERQKQYPDKFNYSPGTEYSDPVIWNERTGETVAQNQIAADQAFLNSLAAQNSQDAIVSMLESMDTGQNTAGRKRNIELMQSLAEYDKTNGTKVYEGVMEKLRAKQKERGASK